jgi:hypothetical protein
MFTTARHFLPANVLLRPKPAETTSTEKRAQKTRNDKACEPERRLWKLTAQAAQPKLDKVELLVLSLFLTIATWGTVTCVQELSRLMTSNAIEHVATKALQ